MNMALTRCVLASAIIIGMFDPSSLDAQVTTRTAKPPLHAKHWMAITGKPLSATAGALTFAKGGNAIDAACAMLASVTTMWDVLSWGGETPALISPPRRPT